MSQDKFPFENNGHSSSPTLNGTPHGSSSPQVALDTTQSSSQDRLQRVGSSITSQDYFPSRYADDYGSDNASLRGVMSMLLRRWPVLLLTFLLVVAAGTAYTLLQRPIYQSVATVVVSAPSSGSTGETELLSSLIDGTAPRSLGTQIAILNSSPVQRGAFRTLPLMTKTVLLEFSKVEIRPQANAEAIDVLVSCYDKKAARDFANAICNQYIEQSQQQNREQVRIATQYVGSQLGPVRDRLKQAATALRNYKERYGVVSLDDQVKARVAQVSDLETQLRQAQSDRVSTWAQLDDLKSQIQQMAPIEERPANIVRSPAVEAMKAQLTQLELRRIATLRLYRPDSREVTDIDKQMQDIRSQLGQQAQTEVGSWTHNVNPIRQNLTQDLARLQGQNWALEARTGAIQESVKQARSDLGHLPEREYQLGQLSIDLDTLRQTYQTLNEKYQTLLISEQARLANARVISPAEAPRVPISPRKTLNIIMSVLIGLLLAVMLVALIDRLDDRVHSEAEARQASGLTVLTQIPMLPTEESLITLPNSNQVVLESYRMLRTNLSFAAIDEPLRSLVVTSSQPGEGKSTSAVNIAIVEALDGKRVILVDCDLRRPSLHIRLKMPNKVGFTSILAGTATLEEALQSTNVPNLYVLTSGPIPPNPTELLNSRAAQSHLRQIFAQADLTIIDSPPALMIADAQILAALADAVVLVISFKEAGRRQIAHTTELLARTGARLVGSVLNKLPKGLGGGYGYYDRYYSSYFDKSGEVALTVPNGNRDEMPSDKQIVSEKTTAHSRQ